VSDNFYEQLAVWSQIVASILFIAVLVYGWIRYIAPAVVKSQERKNAELLEAEQRRDEAKANLQTAQREALEADNDVRAIVERAAHDATDLRTRIVDEARAEGAWHIKNAEGELARSRATAREELRDELLEKAMAIARDAARKLDDATDRRLVDEAVPGADGTGV